MISLTEYIFAVTVEGSWKRQMEHLFPVHLTVTISEAHVRKYGGGRMLWKMLFLRP